MKYYFVLLLMGGLLVSCKDAPSDGIQNSWSHTYEAVAVTGDTLYSATPSEAIIDAWEAKKEAFEKDPNNLENLIWYGRFTAYKGDYRKAIAIYTQGLEQFPNESRLLRHRGHRYITVREFDKAIEDLSKAAELIEGSENKMEEDGMPNAQNIPVSTQHGNIYYHLGLAYYLNRNLPQALDAFKKCLSTSNAPDNVVSCTHWIYMIHNRLGRKAAAENYLRNIHENMNVIENTAYYKACLFYKGLLTEEAINKFEAEATASNSALQYALGNWQWYNGYPQKAKEIFTEILSEDDWASFGYIAAEVDMAKPYVSR